MPNGATPAGSRRRVLDGCTGAGKGTGLVLPAGFGARTAEWRGPARDAATTEIRTVADRHPGPGFGTGARTPTPWRLPDASFNRLPLTQPASPRSRRVRSVLAGEIPGGQRLGLKESGVEIVHRPGRHATPSAPKSVSLMSLGGGDERIVEAHNKVVAA